MRGFRLWKNMRDLSVRRVLRLINDSFPDKFTPFGDEGIYDVLNPALTNRVIHIYPLWGKFSAMHGTLALVNSSVVLHHFGKQFWFLWNCHEVAKFEEPSCIVGR